MARLSVSMVDMIIDRGNNMNKSPICTVLIVTFNHENFIRRTLESVVSQETSYEYRVDIFDDHSTDGTVGILREYEEKYPDLIYLHLSEQNTGAQKNIYRAYKFVSTKYCCMLEGDDYWCDDEKLQKQITALEEHPECSFCAHNTLLECYNDEYRKKEHNKPMVTNRNVRKTGIYCDSDFVPLFGAGWMNHINSRLIRMECVDLESLSDMEDFLYDNCQFFYLLNRGKLFFIKDIMSVYCMNMSSSFTSQKVVDKISGHYRRLLHINESTDKKYDRLIYRHLGSFSNYWLNMDDIATGIKKDYSDLYYLISRNWKKIWLDTGFNNRLKQKCDKKIKELKGYVR